MERSKCTIAENACLTKIRPFDLEMCRQGHVRRAASPPSRQEISQRRIIPGGKAANRE
jgi:hypothetical protein